MHLICIQKGKLCTELERINHVARLRSINFHFDFRLIQTTSLSIGEETIRCKPKKNNSQII
jgi:hypothetical protein